MADRPRALRRAALPCVLAACMGGCAVPQPQNTPVDPRLIAEPITGGVYYLYVPSTYRRDRPAPLIVSCHGTDPFDVAAYQVGEWKMLAEQHGCLLVCPKLSSTDGLLGSGSITRLLADERLIMSILGQLHYLYAIDRRNVLMTGFSGGGFPVYFVGLRHPDLFTCVVARNANFNQRVLEGWYPPEARRTPAMVYFGQNDPVAIRAQSRRAIDYLRGAGFEVETAIVPGSGHERRPQIAMDFWLRHWNGTPPPPRYELGPVHPGP
jgi:poly(3-hydroxybutyrate) depolymerase